jgi:hypothetical protein
MNDLDTSFLTTRLHDLADELAPAVDVTTQVRQARSRHRRRQRGRLAVIATMAATVAVVGVPTAIGALSSAQAPHGQVAHPGISTPAGPPATSAPSDRSTAEEGARLARAVAEMHEVTSRLTTPLSLTAPGDLSGCPDGAGLGRVAGVQFAYWKGSLPGGPQGCLWATDGGAGSLAEDRYAVGIGFLRGTTPAQMRAATAKSDSGCRTVEVPPVATGAVLQRCDTGSGTDWWLDVPDTDGAGIWVLSTSIPASWQGVGAGDGLAAAARLASATW